MNCMSCAWLVGKIDKGIVLGTVGPTQLGVTVV